MVPKYYFHLFGGHNYGSRHKINHFAQFSNTHKNYSVPLLSWGKCDYKVHAYTFPFFLKDL